jgi:hypothetical protein
VLLYQRKKGTLWKRKSRRAGQSAGGDRTGVLRGPQGRAADEVRGRRPKAGGHLGGLVGRGHDPGEEAVQAGPPRHVLRNDRPAVPGGYRRRRAMDVPRPRASRAQAQPALLAGHRAAHGGAGCRDAQLREGRRCRGRGRVAHLQRRRLARGHLTSRRDRGERPAGGNLRRGRRTARHAHRHGGRVERPAPGGKTGVGRKPTGNCQNVCTGTRSARRSSSNSPPW